MATDKITASPDGTYSVLADGRYAVRFERRLAHPIEDVWAAITEPEQIYRWLGEAEIDLVEGGRVRVRWINTMTDEEVAEYGIKGMEDTDEDSVMNATIARLEPPRLLELDSDVFGRLRFELFGEPEGCLLRFSDTFETPAEMLPQTIAGWHIHLEHLDHVLGGGSVNWQTWSQDYLDRWAELRDRYEANTNVPPASSASPPGATGSGA